MRILTAAFLLLIAQSAVATVHGPFRCINCDIASPTPDTTTAAYLRAAKASFNIQVNDDIQVCNYTICATYKRTAQDTFVGTPMAMVLPPMAPGNPAQPEPGYQGPPPPISGYYFVARFEQRIFYSNGTVFGPYYVMIRWDIQQEPIRPPGGGEQEH